MIAASLARASSGVCWRARGPAVLMLSGTDDTFADPAFVSRVAAGLRAAGRTVDVHMYEGAGHAFNFLGDGNSAARLATADAVGRTRAFLARFLAQ